MNKEFDNEMNSLNILINRLKKIGIEIECYCNYPWIYLYKVNGNVIKEKYMAEHGFTIAFLPVRRDLPFHFTDISKIFKIIKKYK